MKSGKIIQTFTYEEDDYLLKRDDKEYIIYGRCSADFTNDWYYIPGKLYKCNGDPGDPEEFDAEINILGQTFSCEVTDIYDADTMEECSIHLTKTERAEFAAYMKDKLIDVAEEYDQWDYKDGYDSSKDDRGEDEDED